MSAKTDHKNSVFIIDSISSAFILATLKPESPVRCIYESKEIDWRETNYEDLYDLILSDVKMSEKKILKVPHPFFIQGKSLLETIKVQNRFIKLIRKLYPLERGYIYYSCTTSSLLISHKNLVPHVLLDEGMGALLTRHDLWSSRKRQIGALLRRFLSEKIVPFKFRKSTPQITLTNDPHPAVLKHLDYREFSSHLFEKALDLLIQKTSNAKRNVLVLVKSPSHNGSQHVKEGWTDTGLYTDFNLRQLKKFIEKEGLTKEVQFFLKSHPSLGKSSELLKNIISGLRELGYDSYAVDDLIDFPESSSLPAEGLLKYADFHDVLALDVSSTLWNVGHHGVLNCHCPLEAIIQFTHVENSPHENIYKVQYQLKEILNSQVSFY